MRSAAASKPPREPAEAAGPVHDGPASASRVVVEDAVSTRVERAARPLYIDRIKVHPRSVRGTFRRAKWAVLGLCLAVYYLAPWLRWDRGPGAPDQALLVDLPGRRAYFFWIEIWPQEVYFLTGLLILGAVGLFLVTSLFGRLWCGYACPQTVWTDLFMLVERWIEGDRNARIRLDKAPWTADKAARKTAKHAAWLGIAAATGGAWTMYFNDAPTVLGEIFTGRASATVYGFVGLFTVTTYTLAGWAREQVCTYMCPWPRFQAAMLDEHSTIVTYQAWRGEPRGKHKAGESWDGRGDCVDCKACVAVCPTGIDIRDGQQLECIGCGLCIDACNEVMPRVGRPPDLIRFDTLARQEAASCGAAPPSSRILRPRTAFYAAVLVCVAGVMAAALATRATLELSVLRDRAPLWVVLSDGRVRNDYTLKILNKTREAHVYELRVEGLPGATLSVVGAERDRPAGADSARLRAEPDSVATWRVHLSAPPAPAAEPSAAISFGVREIGNGEAVRAGTVFLRPPK